MKRLPILLILIMVFAVAMTACDSVADVVDDVAEEIDDAEEEIDSAADAREDEIDATADASGGSGDAPSELCAALGPLDASLDVLEDMDPGEHSVEDYKAQFDIVDQDFQNLRAADTAGVYTVDFDRFEVAMASFEDGLVSLLSGDGGILSAFFGLASGAADLAVAGEILDEAIDCPGIVTKGGIGRDSTESASDALCSAVLELSVSLDYIDGLDPDIYPDLYQEGYDDVQKQWQIVFDRGSDQYPDAFGDFAQAKALYESQLALYRRDPSLGNLTKLGLATGQFVIAEERVGFAVDCPDNPLEDSAEPASEELCSAVRTLSDSLDYIEGLDPDTVPDLYQLGYDDIENEWQVVFELGKDQYPNAFTEFERAKIGHERRLAAWQENPTPSNLLKLTLATGRLVIAEERLGFAVDCPGQ